MKWYLLIVSLFPSLLVAANNHVSIRDVSSVLKRDTALEPVIRSVVHIHYMLKGKGAEGSGFFVSPNHILTALHVVSKKSTGAAPAACNPKTCPGMNGGTGTASTVPTPEMIPCDKLMISGVYTHGRSTRGRSFKCRAYVFADAEADAALIETVGANDNWMPIGDDSQIGSQTVDLFGYPGGTWFIHSRECKVLAAKMSGTVGPTSSQRHPAELFFDAQAVADHGASGGLGATIVKNSDGTVTASAVGIVSMVHPVKGDTIFVRIPDLVHRHPKEFDAVNTAAGK